MGSALAPIPLIGFCVAWLMLAVACSGPGAQSYSPGVQRVFAHVRGIT
jgi:hypothetical protein